MTSAIPLRDRLRVAIQRSGRLGEPARGLLAACGLTWRERGDHLFCHGESLAIDLLLVRDDDIPSLLADGLCDLGIVGRNLLAERAAGDAARGPRELRALGFGRCQLALAVPDATRWDGPETLAGKRIATSYPRLVEEWLARSGVSATVVTLSGSVEIAPRLGQADVVCDLVSSGATLAANGLRPVATLLESEAVLAGPMRPFGAPRAEIAETLLQRIDGVLRLKESRLLLFQTTRSALPGLLRLLPDAEPPTVMRLDGEETLALQALCRSEVGWQRLEELRRAGARGIMVLPVERMLA